MSTVPPNGTNERDETPEPVDPLTSGTPEPSAPSQPGTDTGAGLPPRSEPTVDGPANTGSSATPPPAPMAAPAPTSPASSDNLGAEQTHAFGREPAGGEVPPPPPATADAADAPRTQAAEAPSPAPETGSYPNEGATRQLPTEAEDEALRDERARRFGRVAGTSPAEPSEPAAGTGTVAAGTAGGAAVGAAAAGSDERTTTMSTRSGTEAPIEDEDDPFRDFDDGPTSRAAAHWWGILLAVVFGPVTWYLVTDGGERIANALGQNLDSLNVLGLVEFGGGLLALIVIVMAARWSSVGSIIIGAIGAVIGAAFLAVPRIVSDFLTSQATIFDRLGQFGTNVFDHLNSDGFSGRLLLYGITFIFIGVVSHGARRQGRREERRKAALVE